MIVRTDAVVLRSFEYGETSQIVTLYTRQFGKLAVLARGARTPKSRFGSSIQPMSYAQVVLYYKPTRDLQTLTESSHIVPFHGIGRDLEKISVGLRLVELVHVLMHDEEQNPLAFNLLVRVLQRLDEADARAANLLPYFQLKMAGRLGFTPAVDREEVARVGPDGGMLALENGAVLPLDALTERGMRATRPALRAFAVFARADLEDVMRMDLAPELRGEVADLVEAYLRFHIEGLYPFRTGKVFAQMQDEDGLR